MHAVGGPYICCKFTECCSVHCSPTVYLHTQCIGTHADTLRTLKTNSLALLATISQIGSTCIRMSCRKYTECCSVHCPLTMYLNTQYYFSSTPKLFVRVYLVNGSREACSVVYWTPLILFITHTTNRQLLTECKTPISDIQCQTVCILPHTTLAKSIGRISPHGVVLLKFDRKIPVQIHLNREIPDQFQYNLSGEDTSAWHYRDCLKASHHWCQASSSFLFLSSCSGLQQSLSGRRVQVWLGKSRVVDCCCNSSQTFLHQAHGISSIVYVAFHTITVAVSCGYDTHSGKKNNETR